MASLKLSSILLLAATMALGHGVDPNHARRHPAPTPTLQKRQNPYPTGPAYDVPTPIVSIVPTPLDFTANTLAIMSTYAGGVAASLSGAPPLPERMLFYLFLLIFLICRLFRSPSSYRQCRRIPRARQNSPYR